jgi:dTDP-4-amino-4,6-dideoxygalactose transaminase
MLWSLHGQTKDALSKTKIGSWEYDIDRLGYKFNMTDMTAALGLAQLERYDGLLKKRKAIIEYYIKALDKLDVNCLEHFTADYVSSGHLFLVRINGIDEFKRNKVVIKMAREGIATNVHYKPLPMHTAYKKLGFDIKEFANSYNQYKNEITLPLHTLLTDAETEYVAEKFINIIKGIK